MSYATVTYVAVATCQSVPPDARASAIVWLKPPTHACAGLGGNERTK